MYLQSPEYLIEWHDAIADLLDTNRTGLLVEAIHKYFEETADSEMFQKLDVTKYYYDQLQFETVK